MSTPTVDGKRLESSRFSVALKATLSTPMVDGRHSASRFLVALKATSTSALKVVGILFALKATVDRIVNSYC